MSGEANLDTSVKENTEISIVFRKFCLVVSMYLPLSSSLSEKAIPWITKSNFPHSLLM